MNTIKLFILPLLVLISLACRDEDPIEVQGEQGFTEYLEEEMRVQEIPAMSILIFNKDVIKYEKYLGKSNLEKDLALQANDLFLLASISKTITATALLQLNEKGLFQLDDKVNDYLPFQVNVPNYATSITFRMLLTHTSGIADGSSLDGQYFYGKDSPIELGVFLQNYLEVGGSLYNASENYYEFEPGTEHEYSNTGNALMGHLVEVISGKNFNQYCKENIFIPLGMTNTFWRLDEISQNMVQPYTSFGRGDFEAIEQYAFTDYPNGGLRSTGRDMFRFLSALAQKGTYNGSRILSPATVAQMVTPQIPGLDEDMGLHLIRMNKEFNLWGHDGGEQGVATMMAYNPTTLTGVLIFTNQEDADLDTILREAYQLGITL